MKAAAVPTAKPLLDMKKWQYLGRKWVPLSNSIEVCDAIFDKDSKVTWSSGRGVVVKHTGAKASHTAVVVAVGFYRDKPQLVLHTGQRFESTPINKDVTLDTGAPVQDVEQLWNEYYEDHKPYESHKQGGVQRPQQKKQKQVEGEGVEVGAVSASRASEEEGQKGPAQAAKKRAKEEREKEEKKERERRKRRRKRRRRRR